jgi:hypothetical protein
MEFLHDPRQFYMDLFWNKQLSILKFPIIFVIVSPKFFYGHTCSRLVLQWFLELVLFEDYQKNLPPRSDVEFDLPRSTSFIVLNGSRAFHTSIIPSFFGSLRLSIHHHRIHFQNWLRKCLNHRRVIPKLRIVALL